MSIVCMAITLGPVNAFTYFTTCNSQTQTFMLCFFIVNAQPIGTALAGQLRQFLAAIHKYSLTKDMLFRQNGHYNCHYPPGNHHMAMLATSKTVLFPGHIHLITTDGDDLTL